MKKITLLTSLVLLTTALSAQSLLPTKYGIKVGLNMANVNSTTSEGIKNIKNTASFGVAGGFYMEIALNDTWYINPELLYCQKGANFDYDFTHDYAINQRDEHSTTNKLKLGYVELNPTISYRASQKVALNFGPSLSYLIQSDYVSNETSTGTSETHELLEESIYTENTIDIALNLGVSYYINEDFLIDTKIATGFMSIGDITQQTYTGSEENQAEEHKFSLKNRGILFSVAYLF